MENKDIITLVAMYWAFGSIILGLTNFALFMHYANEEPKWLYNLFKCSLCYFFIMLIAMFSTIKLLS